MNVRPRLLIGSFASARSGMSKVTKPPTHYDTLKVKPRATQREIKSAYFKLSKQYHPDKNSSEEATAKFRDITEAYEVLGNFDSRKTYDRSIRVRTSHRVPQGTSLRDDPRAQYYQMQAAMFRYNTKTGSVPTYDFNAWTKAHYGRTLERNMIDKIKATQRSEDRQFNEDGRLPLQQDVGYVVFALVMGSILVVLAATESNDNISTMTIRQEKEIQKQNNLESLTDSVTSN